MDLLAMLKRNLQLLSQSNDDFLNELLKSTDSFIQREGIVDDGSDEYKMIKVQYAAYLFRKRDAPDTSMPRYLRYEMNNLLFAQKSK